MSRDWTELANPFPKATKLAEEIMQRQVPPDVVGDFGDEHDRAHYGSFLQHIIPWSYRRWPNGPDDPDLKMADKFEVSGWTLLKLAEGEISWKDKAGIYVLRYVVDEALAELVDDFDHTLVGLHGDEEQRRKFLLSEWVDHPDYTDDRDAILSISRRIQVCKEITTDINQVTEMLRQEIEYQQKGMELG